MKKLLPLLAFFSGLNSFCVAGNSDLNKYLQGECAFTPNLGQLRDMNGKPADSILAYYTTSSLSIYITNQGVTYVMRQFEENKDAQPHPVFVAEKKSLIHYSRVDVDLPGAQISKQQLVWTDELVWKSNYYKSSDGKGQLAVPHYKTLTIKNIYPGIDWVWKCQGNHKLEYNFIVHQGANPSDIVLNYYHCDIVPKANNLRIHARYGTLDEGPLQARCQNTPVSLNYVFDKDTRSIRFSTGDYDHTADLEIDPPLQLEWSDEFGGDFSSGLRGITTDNSGYIYMVGYTNSPDFPIMIPSDSAYVDSTYNGNSDVVVLKIDSAETLLWSTFLGGGGDDYGNSISVGINGFAYITGSADTGFPVQPYAGAYNQTTCVAHDAFISAFDTAMALVWSTYYGGNGHDEGLKIFAHDTTGIYVAGYTTSTTFPTYASIPGAYLQTSVQGTDGFILWFAGPGQWNRNWATVYGGNGNDFATSLTCDSGQNLVVCGFTNSTNLPVLNPGSGYYQGINGGSEDGFILHFDNAVRKSATYYGGSRDDYFTDIVTDPNGTKVLTGWTNSTNFPVDTFPSAYRQDNLAGAYDGTIVQLDTVLGLQWATYYGGSDTDVATAITTDQYGRIYITGFTFSQNFPLDSPHFAGAWYQPTNHGVCNGFLAAFTSFGHVFWSTYKGDTCYQYPNDIAFDPSDKYFYVAGDDLLDCQSLPDSDQVSGGNSQVGFCWAFGSASDVVNNNQIPDCFLRDSVYGVTLSCPDSCSGKAKVLVGGGVPPYSVVWSSGESGDSALHLCAGPNAVEISDAIGCAVQSTFNVNSLTLNMVVTNVGCSGYGNIFAHITQGTPPYYYYWSNGYQGLYENEITSQDSVTLSVTVTDAAGCSITGTGHILNNDSTRQYSISIQTPTCGADDGVLVALNNGVPTKATWILYSPGFSTVYDTIIADTITAGFDTVYFINQAFCPGYNNQNAYAVFLDSLVWDSVDSYIDEINDCPSLPDYYRGGYNYFLIYPYADNSQNIYYQWSDGESGDNYTYSNTDYTSGNYSLTLTDDYGCSASFSYVLLEYDSGMVLNMGSTPAYCTASNGTAWVNVANGTPPFTYEWLNIITDYSDSSYDTITGLAASTQYSGPYILQLEDSIGCVIRDTITVNDIPDPNFDDSLFYTGCESAYDSSGSYLGFALVNPGGIGPFTVVWSTNATTDTIYDLPPGAYADTVTDGVGCKIVTNFNINTIFNIYYLLRAYKYCADSGTITYVYKLSGADSLRIDTGSTSPFVVYPDPNTGYIFGHFVLDTSSSPPHFSAFTENNLCSFDTTPGPASIVPSNPNTSILLLSHSVCAHDSNTVLLASMFDTYANPYNPSLAYGTLWSNGDSTETVSNLPPGAYSVTVTDQVGCTGNANITISPTDSITIDTSYVQNAVCQLGLYGSISLVPASGSGNYQYRWSNQQQGSSDTVLNAGNYQCTITDAGSGCSVTRSFVVTGYPPLSLSGQAANAACAGSASGSITITVAGGSGAYAYQWSNHEFSAHDTLLTQGNYNCTVTDTSGCSAVFRDSIAQLPPFVFVKDSIINDKCIGNTNGRIVLFFSGGSGHYSFEWNNGERGAADTLLGTGYYSCTVTDLEGCGTSVEADSVIQPSAIILFVATQNVECYGENTGSIDVTATGGTFPYSYNWSSGNNGTMLSAGTYRLTVTDANSCSVTLTSHITQPLSGINASVTSNNPSCFDSANGNIHLHVHGGSPPYSYKWSNFSTDSALISIDRGVYVCTITDENGCFVIDSIPLILPDSLTLSVIADNATCYDSSDGVVQVSVTGGTPAYVYLWNNAATNNLITHLAAGPYSCTVTDANNCIASVSLNISQPAPLTARFNSFDPTCGYNNGQTMLDSIVGGSPPYTWQWSNGNEDTGISNLSGGIYFITVIDNNGCVYIFDDSLQCVTGILNVLSDIDFSVYPNPASDYTIVAYNFANRENTAIDLRICDALGQSVYNKTLDNSGQQTLNISTWAPGIYLLFIKKENGIIAAGKLVKQ